METYTIFASDRQSPWLHEPPRLTMLCDSNWKDGHFHLLHEHADISEILLVCEGGGVYAVDHMRYQVATGDVILCNTGAVHEEVLEKGAAYATLCLSLQGLRLPGLPIGHLLAPGESPVFHAPPEFADMLALTERAIACVKARAPYYREQCQGLMLAVLALVQRMVAGRDSKHCACADPLCAAVERYIGAHYTEELTLERLGREFHISPWHLAHLFKAHTGYTLKQYLLRRRIGEAQIFLMNGDRSIASIAEAVGFADAAHFSKLFSKYVGMAPSDYRIYRTNTNLKR